MPKLQPCPDCDAEISPSAKACPHCGCPMRATGAAASLRNVSACITIASAIAGWLLMGYNPTTSAAMYALATASGVMWIASFAVRRNPR